MKIRATLPGLVVLLLLGAEDKPAALKEFTSAAAGFSVRVPGDMKETVKNVPSQDGKGGVRRTYICAPDPKVIYLVLQRDRPDLAKASPEAMNKALEEGSKSAEKALKGKLLGAAKKITLGKHPGREFQIESKDGLYRSRVFVVDGRMYEVTILAPKEVATSKAADEYLDSFKLVEKKEE